MPRSRRPHIAQAVGPAFNCTTPTAFMSESTPNYNSNTQLYDPNSMARARSPSRHLGRSTLSYNAMGFNPNDNYLYAIQIGTNHLVQIDSTGTATDLGAVSGLPTPTGGSAPAYFTGAFDGITAVPTSG